MARTIIEQAGAIAFRSTDSEPEILLVRASKTPDAWVFPKGHIEPHESSEAAARREAGEEGGVVGRVVRPVHPSLEFDSGAERVRVQYYLLAAVDERPPDEPRERRWFTPDAALRALTHDDARALLSGCLADILEEAALEAAAGGGVLPCMQDDGFRDLLLAEYNHVGDSLLRNEEDGEKRVTFFLTIAGAAGTVLAFLLGANAAVGPETTHALVVFTLAVVAAIGYLTFVRVVARNVASDRYKAALSRIRRAFLTGRQDRRAAYLAFDPFRRDSRSRLSWRSIGRGGWLETVALAEALVLGALLAMLVSTNSWWLDVTVGALAASLSWGLLIADANRRYAESEKRRGG